MHLRYMSTNQISAHLNYCDSNLLTDIMIQKCSILVAFSVFWAAAEQIESSFPLEMDISTQGLASTQVHISNKQVQLDLDLQGNEFSVCCKPSRSLFQIVHNFLMNPFFQINEFACPHQYQTNGKGELVLPKTGIISINYQIIESPSCQNGILGLAKNSVFISSLPITFEGFRVSVQKKANAFTDDISLAFGQLEDSQTQETIEFDSLHPVEWDLGARSIKLGNIKLEEHASIVLILKSHTLKIPEIIHRRIISYFETDRECQQGKCLCNSGVSKSFPTFKVTLTDQLYLEISPSLYMKIDSNICTLLFKVSYNKHWYIDISLLEEKIIYFSRNDQKIRIKKMPRPAPVQQKWTNIFNVPSQLILNCSVVLLLCVFLALLIVELIKRLSGFSDSSNQSIAQYLARGEINRHDDE